MAKCPHNKNASTIKTSLVETGIDEYVASLVASTLVLSIIGNDTGPSVGDCQTDTDSVHQSTPIRMVNMKDDICHEVEGTVITTFYGSHSTMMSTINQKT